MREITNTDIYVWVHMKYQNNLMPRIPDVITSYLIAHPDKLDYYLNSKITKEMLISYLAFKYKESHKADLLNDIVSFMEAPHER